MPTYEYRCPSGHHFELFQRISDEPKAECPQCGKSAERLLSAGAGFLFKGSGFYITDYRSEQYRKSASAESSDGSVAAGATSSKSSKEKPEAADTSVTSTSSGKRGGGAASPGKKDGSGADS